MQLKNTNNNTSKKPALPYRLYLDALILSGMYDEEIVGNLMKHQLNPIPDDIEREMSETFSRYKKEYGDDSKNYPGFIKKMISYLLDLPGTQPYMKDIMHILADPILKNWIQVMAMGDIDPGLIFVLISSKVEKITEEAVFHDYIKYFFNVPEMSAIDKFDVLNQETDDDVKDNYKLALEYNKEELLWKLGFTPDIPIETLVKGIAAESYMRMKNARDNSEVARLGTLGLRCVDQLRGFDEEKLIEERKTKDISFKVLGKEPKVRSISDIIRENEAIN